MDTLDPTTTAVNIPVRHLPDCRRLPGCEDRRIHDRLRRSLPVSYRAGGLRWTRSNLLSLSASGARVLLHERLEPGQRLHIRLEIAPDWQPQVVGVPVWHQTLGGRTQVVGLRFEPLRPEDEDRLRLWVRRQVREEYLA